MITADKIIKYLERINRGEIIFKLKCDEKTFVKKYVDFVKADSSYKNRKVNSNEIRNDIQTKCMKFIECLDIVRI